MKYATPILCALLTVIACLQNIDVASVIPLKDKDGNGCGIGEEYRNDSCKLCKPGTYRFFTLEKLETKDPWLCPTLEDDYDSKIPPSDSRCMPCRPGTYNPFEGAASHGRCRPCPVGTTSWKGARKCRKCAPGKSSAAGSPRCVKCSAGFHMTRPCRSGVAPTSACTKCPRGTYSSEANSAECVQCPGGTSTVKRGAISKAFCKTCGTEGVRCSCRQNGEPWKSVGSYRPIGHAVCTECPPGTRALSPFATSASECIPCPNGTSHVRFQGCQKCAKGLHSFGIGASYCRKKKDDECPFESFKDPDGVCKLCPAGYKFDGSSCTKCPAGTVSQGYRSKFCEKCKFPQAAPSNGDGFCECARDHFYDVGNTYDCLPCPKGSSIDKEFHSDSECEVDCENFPNFPQCKPCKADFERDYDTKKCMKCKKGFRSLVGEELCVDPRTGCGEVYEFCIGVSRYGYSLSCVSSNVVGRSVLRR